MNIEPIQKRNRRIRDVVFLALLTLFLFLYNWVAEAIPQAHLQPGVPKLDIRLLLKQSPITEEQLTILSGQTGLHPCIINKLLKQDKAQQLLQLQQHYFSPVHIESLNTTPLTISEHLVDGQGRRTTAMPLVDLQDGDILITKNSRFLGWRNGHAALVVDAGNGLILEAIMLGTVTKLSSAEKWSTYPSFQVLRLKEEYALKDESAQKTDNSVTSLPKKVATYAENNLTDVPYHLHAGIFERISPSILKTVQAAEQEEADTTLKGTHCAHLVWYAYKQFGIDLDSDGGLIVTPYDIQNSDYLEVIQSFGY